MGWFSETVKKSLVQFTTFLTRKARKDGNCGIPRRRLSALSALKKQSPSFNTEVSKFRAGTPVSKTATDFFIRQVKRFISLCRQRTNRMTAIMPAGGTIHQPYGMFHPADDCDNAGGWNVSPTGWNVSPGG